MVKAIFFDFWGTLVEQGIRSPTKEVQFILRLRNMPFSEFVLKFEEVFMTKKYESLQQGFEEVVTEFGLRIPPFVVDKLIGMWNKNALLSHLYEDTLDALNALKEEYKLVLIANADPFSINAVLDKYRLREYFTVISLSYETGLLKSNPDSFAQILKDLDLDAADVVMVGDSLESDMKSAEKAGIKGILIDRREKQEFSPKISTLLDLKNQL